jgi:lipopolysaccharide export system protein LptC
MRVSLHHVFPIAALTALAAGSIWLERATRGPDTAPAQAAQQGPDVVVEQMAITRFDINGRPHYYLDARQMEHLPGTANSHLTDPVVNLLRDDSRMRLAADTAVARDDGERVDLAGNVRGERMLPDAPPMHFASASLVVWPNVESAKSLDPVTITQEGAVARGNGMTADNVFGLITLTGQVQAHMPIKRK